MSDETRTQFDYLLNAFEAASQHPEPGTQDYAAKRVALLGYVRQLEQELNSTRSLLKSLDDLIFDADQLGNDLRSFRADAGRIRDGAAAGARIWVREKSLASVSSVTSSEGQEQ